MGNREPGGREATSTVGKRTRVLVSRGIPPRTACSMGVMGAPQSDRLPGATPAASSAQVRRRMQVTRQKDTPGELALRRELHRRGLRYRVDRAVVPGTRRRPDVVFPRERVAVFLDGCFWHNCPEHGTQPKANSKWWRDKIAANEQRDRDTDRRLREAGWVVIRAWEHEDPVDVADRAEAHVLASRREVARG